MGINPKTIRYYEEIGLLPKPERSASGYRLYSAADLERLRFIAKAKAIGLTLDEVHEILDAAAGGERPCQQVLGMLDQKIEVVDRQLHALSKLRQELLSLRSGAAETMTADTCVCGIIEQHQGSDSLAEAPLGLISPKTPKH